MATILGTLGIMAVLNPFIAFVVVAVTPVSIWFAGFVAKRTAGFFAANSAAQGRLSDEERHIVVLHAVCGLKHREIAQFLGLALPTVLSKYHRSLKKLKTILEGDDAQ